MPAVSVIVPNYNHARFLRRRIESILRQTFQDFELILLDDCSTDDSRSILREYASDPRIRLKFNEVNSGSTFKQWNNGIRLAQGKYIWIAESDDYADHRLLERLVAVLDSDPRVAFAYCRSWSVVNDEDSLDGFVDFYPDPLDPRWKADFSAEGREECQDYFIRDTPVPNTSSVVFRKAVYEQVGRADESFRVCGDWKLWAAMALTGKVAYVGEPLNYYRSHNATLRSAIWGERPTLNVRYVEERLQVVRWILDRVTPSQTVLRKAYVEHSNHWVPTLISPRVPLRSKVAIAKLVRQIDPHPIWRAVRTASLMRAVWLARNYVWHPILNWTRAIRHAIGLNHDNICAVLKRHRKQTRGEGVIDPR